MPNGVAFLLRKGHMKIAPPLDGLFWETAHP